MRNSTGKTRSSTVRTMLVVGAMLLAFDAGAAQAADEAQAETQGSQIESSVGVDMTTKYFFRGILQEDQGVIAQPWVDFVVPLSAGENTSWSLNLGIWNSLHDGLTGSDGPGSMHYELDAYVGVGVDFAENWSASATYVALTSPNSTFLTVHELDFSVSFDDSGLFGGGSRGFSGVQPSALLVWEVDGQADGGAHEGIYLELGIEPGFNLIDQEKYPLSISFPVAAGLSLSNYFEDAVGNDDFYGFLQGGVSLSIPLSFVPAKVGSWTLSGGASILLMGDNLEAINGGDDSEVIFSLGLGIAF